VDSGVSGQGARRDEEGGPGLCLLGAVYSVKIESGRRLLRLRIRTNQQGNAPFLCPSHTRVQVDSRVSGQGARRDKEGGP